MKAIFIVIIALMMLPSTTLFDFNRSSSLTNWRVVNDGVMGGLSQGAFTINENGHGKFFGNVRLENNGGFSSVRYTFKTIDVSEFSKVCILLKGDGKKYQFRIKDNARQYYSYIYPFETSGEWQTVEIPLQDMYPSFRGRRVKLPNFSEDTIEQLVFLIGNKKKESFELLIDKSELK